VGAPLAGAGGISGGQWLAMRAWNDEVEGRWRVAARAATRGGGRPEGWVEGAAGQPWRQKGTRRMRGWRTTGGGAINLNEYFARALSLCVLFFCMIYGR